MCGILGVINGKGWTKAAVNDYLKQGVIVGQLRGDDSTGLLQVSKNDSYKVLKAPVDGYTFGQYTKVRQALADVSNASATIIHHRAATHGSVNIDNAHPFDHNLNEGHVVGVHNGTLYSHQRSQDGKTFDVDSDWLYYNIAKKGAAEFLGEVNGAYALAWYDVRAKTFNLASNLERPLHFAFIHRENSLLIASEMEMLYWLATRNKLEIEKPLWVPDKSILVFEKDGSLRDFTKIEIEEKRVARPLVHYTSTHPSIGNDYTTTSIKEYGFEKGEEVDFYYKMATPSAGRSGMWEIHGEVISSNATCMDAIILSANQVAVDNIRKSLGCTTKVSGVNTFVNAAGKHDFRLIVWPVVNILEYDDKKDANAIELVDIPEDKEALEESLPLVRGPRGHNIPVTKYMELVKYGCGNCSKDLGLKDADFIGWVSGDQPVCQDCVEELAAEVYVR